MSYNQARNTIQDKFKTEFAVLYPNFSVVFDNLKSDKNTDGFIQFSILNGASTLKGLGKKRLFRYPGVISIDIFHPLKKGTKLVDEMADNIEDIFRAKTFSGITCRSVIRNDIGKEENFWRVNLSYPFYRNKIES
jgi:hypothetical protein